MSQQLDSLIAEKFDSIFQAGEELLQNKKYVEAEIEFNKAWSVVPEPKHIYDMYSQVYSRFMVDFYLELQNYSKAQEWLLFTYKAYEPLNKPSKVSLQFLSARVAFESKDFDKAFNLFKELYDEFKLRPFKGYDNKYIDFFREELKKRKPKKK